MAFITMICPNCGGQAQIEAGHSAMCPYCGNEMAASPVDTGAAFAQDMQFAPPPAQAAVQMQDPFLQQQAAMQQQAGTAIYAGAACTVKEKARFLAFYEPRYARGTGGGARTRRHAVRLQ